MAKAGVGRAKASKVRARGQGKKTTDLVMPLMGFVTWTDPQKKPTPFILDADYDPKEETGHICLNVNLREIASIEFRPVRRPLLDPVGRVDQGHVEDAIRLANST